MRGAALLVVLAGLLAATLVALLRRKRRQGLAPIDLGVEQSEGWDAWWRTRLSAHEPALEHVHYFPVVRRLLPYLRSRPTARVLSAGCGIDLEVRALRAAGIHVTGLDASTVALEHARTCTHFETHADRLLDADDYRPGGQAEWVLGSIFDPAACPGPFDAIVCGRMLQYCWRSGRLDDALAALRARLAPDGILVVQSHGDVPSFFAIDEAAPRHGFALQWLDRTPDGKPVPEMPLFIHGRSTG